MNKFIFTTILAAGTVLLMQCIASENYSCTYTPDGQNFQVCYQSSDNDEEKASKACAEFSGSTFGNLEACSTQDIGARCTGVNVNNIGTVEYALYSTQGKQYCEQTLEGTYVPAN